MAEIQYGGQNGPQIAFIITYIRLIRRDKGCIMFFDHLFRISPTLVSGVRGRYDNAS